MNGSRRGSLTTTTASNPLKGITYSEFDNTVGPRLLGIFPKDAISKEEFEIFSDYVIVGKHLCEKVITIKTDELHYMNYSIAIDNPKYERNALLFALGFVLTKDANTDSYETVLRKLSNLFLALEIEKEFLFQEARKAKIQNALQVLYGQLVRDKETCLCVDASNYISLKLFRPPKMMSAIHDYDVPILRYPKSFLSNLPWDLSLRHLLVSLDGVSHVKKIASATAQDKEGGKVEQSSDMGLDLDCVKLGLQALWSYGCIIVSDRLQFTNVYSVNTKWFDAEETAEKTAILSDVQAFCAMDSDNKPSIARITKILRALQPGVKLKQVIQYSLDISDLSGIDLRKLIAISQEKLLIRRMHEYPIYYNECDLSGKRSAEFIDPCLAGCLDGSECLDSICCSLGKAQKEILSSSHIHIIYK